MHLLSQIITHWCVDEYSEPEAPVSSFLGKEEKNLNVMELCQVAQTDSKTIKTVPHGFTKLWAQASYDNLFCRGK